MFSNKRPQLDHGDMAASAKRPRYSSGQQSRSNQNLDLSLTMPIDGYYLQSLLHQFANMLLPMVQALGASVRLDFAINTFLTQEWNTGRVPLLNGSAFPSQADGGSSKKDPATPSLANQHVDDKTDPGHTLFSSTPTHTDISTGSAHNAQTSKELNCVQCTGLFHETGVHGTTQTCRRPDCGTQHTDQSIQTDAGITDTLQQQNATPSAELNDVSAEKETRTPRVGIAVKEAQSTAVTEEVQADSTLSGLHGDVKLKDQNVEKESTLVRTGQHSGNLIQLTGPLVHSPLKQNGNGNTVRDNFAQNGCLPRQSDMQPLTARSHHDGCCSDKTASCVDSVCQRNFVQSVNKCPMRNMPRFIGNPDSWGSAAQLIRSLSSEDQVVFRKECPGQAAQDSKLCVNSVDSGDRQSQTIRMNPGSDTPGQRNGIWPGAVRAAVPFNGPVLQRNGNVMHQNNDHQVVTGGMPFRSGPVTANRMLAPRNIPTPGMTGQISPVSSRPQIWNGPESLNNNVAALGTSGPQFHKNLAQSSPSFAGVVSGDMKQSVGNLIQLTGGAQSAINENTQRHTHVALVNDSPSPAQRADSAGLFTAGNAQTKGPAPQNPYSVHAEPTGHPVAIPIFNGEHSVQAGAQVPPGLFHPCNNEGGNPTVSSSVSDAARMKECEAATLLHLEGHQPGAGETGHSQSSRCLIGQSAYDIDWRIGRNCELSPDCVSKPEVSCTASGRDITAAMFVSSGSLQDVQEECGVTVPALGQKMQSADISRPPGDRHGEQRSGTHTVQTGREHVDNADGKSVSSEQKSLSRTPLSEDIPLPDDNGQVPSLQSIPLPDDIGSTLSLQSIPLPDENFHIPSLQSKSSPDDIGSTLSLQSIPLPDENGHVPSLHFKSLPDTGHIPSLQPIPLSDENSGHIPSLQSIPLPDENSGHIPSLQSIPLPDECVLQIAETAIEQTESAGQTAACSGHTDDEAKPSATGQNSAEMMDAESSHTSNSGGTTPEDGELSTSNACEETPTSKEDEKHMNISEEEKSPKRMEIKNIVNQIQKIVGQLSGGNTQARVIANMESSQKDFSPTESQPKDNGTSPVGNMTSEQDENSSFLWSSGKRKRLHQSSETDRLSTRSRGTMTSRPLRMNRRIMTDMLCTADSGTLTSMVTWRETSTLTDKSHKKDASTLTSLSAPTASCSSQTVSPVVDVATEMETTPPHINTEDTDLNEPILTTMGAVPTSQLMRRDQGVMTDQDHTNMETELMEEGSVLASRKSQCVGRKEDCEKAEELHGLPTVAKDEGIVRLTIKVKIGKGSRIRQLPEIITAPIDPSSDARSCRASSDLPCFKI